jgi:signal transduction histidine kinase
MKTAKELFDYDSLAFFGRVNASISHELKNIMAIISETAGVLNDLSALASTGTPLNVDMLRSSTASIMEEIQRGFTTIRQMNRFSHSIDTPVVEVDLTEVLDLACRLSDYLSFAGRTNLLPWDGDAPVVQSCPFALHRIFYEMLVYYFKHTERGSELDISIQSTSDSEWMVVLSGFGTGKFQVFPDEQTKKTATSIGVNIDWEPSADLVTIRVPLTFQAGVAEDDASQATCGGNTPHVRVEAT